MDEIELRDPADARRVVIQGLCLARVATLAPPNVRSTLEWALETASEGIPLPPCGFVADLGNLALGTERRAGGPRPDSLAGLDSLLRSYEDYVLGKLYADAAFGRAADVLRRLQGRDRARGIAFVIQQFRARAGFPGVLLSPAVIRALLEASPGEVVASAWDSLARLGPAPELVAAHEALARACRSAADVLGPEDVFELEHGTALAPLGQRVALRQLVAAAQALASRLPAQPPRPRPGRREVPTHILDEDVYPVGGFA